LNIRDYATLVFDCDGVVLDSNRIKREAFRVAAAPWGRQAADKLVSYHLANGGISRYAKFAHFLEHIVPEHASQTIGPSMNEMLAAFAKAVRQGLSNCRVTEGLEDLRLTTRHARWLIASGGDQQELREVFAARKLVDWFNGGVFGSPDDKKLILSREFSQGNIVAPAVYLGDSKYDYECARSVGLDFIFVYGWTEVSDWRCFVSNKSLRHIENVGQLAPK
jgi:phosphoglycolate phosphatase-like HAD superfamily hydrolase